MSKVKIVQIAYGTQKCHILPSLLDDSGRVWIYTDPGYSQLDLPDEPEDI